MQKALSIIVWIMHMHNVWHLPQGGIWHLCSCPEHGHYMVVETGLIKSDGTHNTGLTFSSLSSCSRAQAGHLIFLMWSSRQCALALFTMVCLEQNWESALETRLEVKGEIWVLAFYPHPCFITANKGGLHWGLLSRLGLLSHATCMEQPAIHMQIWPRQD